MDYTSHAHGAGPAGYHRPQKTESGGAATAAPALNKKARYYSGLFYLGLLKPMLFLTETNNAAGQQIRVYAFQWVWCVHNYLKRTVG